MVMGKVTIQFCEQAFVVGKKWKVYSELEYYVQTFHFLPTLILTRKTGWSWGKQPSSSVSRLLWEGRNGRFILSLSTSFRPSSFCPPLTLPAKLDGHGVVTIKASRLFSSPHSLEGNKPLQVNQLLVKL